MTPAPEKAAPIPADAIYATVRDIFGNRALCHQGTEAMVDAAVRAGIKLAADRASQEERARDEESGFVQLPDVWLAIEMRAVESELANWPVGLRASFESALRASDRARLRGDGHAD